MSPPLNDLQVYVVEEFVEHYRDGTLNRRDLVKRVLAVTGGIAATATLLLTLGCASNPVATPTVAPKPTELPASPTTATSAAAVSTPAANGPQGKLTVRADDPAIAGSDVSFPGGDASLMGYLAQPKSAGPFPAVLVCHENRGLVEHVRDVTRRLAKAGYVGLAVDLLSRSGGTDKVAPSLVAAQLTANPNQPATDFQSAFQYLQTLPIVKKSAIGMIGFCYGGGITWRTVELIPELKAAVPFYGPNPALEDVPKIKAAVLGIYGGDDTRIDAGIPAIEDAMKQNGKIFEKQIYPGANHAFNNDAGPSWNEQASYDAWQRALDWFGKYIVTP